ncbi:hypothetical protein HELA111659_07500 [Helicobacter labetoulli]
MTPPSIWQLIVLLAILILIVVLFVKLVKKGVKLLCRSQKDKGLELKKQSGKQNQK